MKLTSTEIIKYSGGNPGALSILTQLDKDNPKHSIILDTLDEAPAIKGPKSDLSVGLKNETQHTQR